jgi:hypothetical protein
MELPLPTPAALNPRSFVEDVLPVAILLAVGPRLPLSTSSFLALLSRCGRRSFSFAAGE